MATFDSQKNKDRLFRKIILNHENLCFYLTPDMFLEDNGYLDKPLKMEPVFVLPYKNKNYLLANAIEEGNMHYVTTLSHVFEVDLRGQTLREKFGRERAEIVEEARRLERITSRQS